MVHSGGKNWKLRKTAYFFVVKSIFLGVFILKKKCKKKIFLHQSLAKQSLLIKIWIFGRNFNYMWHLRWWFLTIFCIKKVIFGTFLKLFWRCSGYVRALFLDLKCPFLAFFLLARFVYDLQNRHCESKFDDQRGWFLTIFWVKKDIYGTFSKLLWSCSGCV